MRELRTKQLPLINQAPEHHIAQELNAIAHLIDNQSDEIYERIAADASRSLKSPESNRGAKGMSAEQILRCLIVKIWFGYSYDSLAFHILDSITLQNFCMIGIYGKFFGKSAINRNIKALSPETLAYINERIVLLAKELGIEKGNKSRSDATPVGTNIHHPTDSSLLWDAVRVLIRMLYEVRDILGLPGLSFQDHTRSAKKRSVEIFYAKTEEVKKASYVALLDITRRCASYGRNAVELISRLPEPDLNLFAMRDDLLEKLELVDKIVDQAERRVLRSEKVPSQDKLVSLFEPHTDIIVKDNRGVHFGHKVYLTTGASNLVIDVHVAKGNPADSDLACAIVQRQIELYGRPPIKTTFDGGFASKKNLAAIKELGVKDVCFAKKRGLQESDMSRSHYVYQKLRRFRAGIEAGISWLKRRFEMDRCNWKGFESFQSYVLATVIGANLLTIARAQLKRSAA